MLVSVWKSENEIQRSLSDAQRVAVFSCNVCANLNGTGGKRGLKQMKRLLKKWGKEILVARTVNVCCSEEIMRQCLRIFIEPVKDRCDALIMLSCAGGVKSAFFCDPGIPVVAALDSFGSGVITTSMEPLEAGICQSCDHCVLTWTGGICPLAGCPAKKRYGPCKKAPVEGIACGIEPDRECVWKKIEKKGDLAALAVMAEIHGCKDYERLPPAAFNGSPGFVRKTSGWFMARMPGISGLIDLIK
ncbi:MAG: methylenetetrahydrofolate reductase C-terminal domain-containing protein [Thermodesulfobacteriota bacterium]